MTSGPKSAVLTPVPPNVLLAKSNASANVTSKAAAHPDPQVPLVTPEATASPVSAGLMVCPVKKVLLPLSLVEREAPAACAPRDLPDPLVLLVLLVLLAPLAALVDVAVTVCPLPMDLLVPPVLLATTANPETPDPKDLPDSPANADKRDPLDLPAHLDPVDPLAHPATMAILATTETPAPQETKVAMDSPATVVLLATPAHKVLLVPLAKMPNIVLALVALTSRNSRKLR